MAKDFDELAKRVQKVAHGFSQMREEAEKIVAEHSSSELVKIAKELFASEVYQVRMVGVFVLGTIAAEVKEAFTFMYSQVSKDESWQVQEILAQAFDRYCKDVGYEESLPVIKEWLKDKNPNVRRAVSEGLRIWNYKDYFKKHPEVAVKLLSALRDDESEYVRKSVGNAIRDISRKEKELVREELEKWDTSDKRVKQVYDLARKFL